MASKTPHFSLPILRRSLTTTRSLRTPFLPRHTSSHRNISFSPSSSPSAIFFRAAHSIPRPPPAPRKPVSSAASSDDPTSNSNPNPNPNPNESFRPDPKGPAYYQLSFTCVPCGHRSHHNVSKQAYHHGSSLITCPGCRNRHVISDHLNIFGDRKITVEDLMRERGRLVKRGSLGEDGDIEFWPEEEQKQEQEQEQEEGKVPAQSIENKEEESKS